MLAVAAFAALSAGILALLSQYEVTSSDLRPGLAAGALVLSRSGNVYSDPLFIYPPSMALAFVPFVHVGASVIFVLFGYTELLCVGVACALTVRALGVLRWVEVGCGCAAVVLLARVTRDSFGSLNVHAYLLPCLVAILVLWARDRWADGAYVLMATALVKPIFAPLLLLPLVRGHARDLVRPAVAGGLVVVVSAALVPGGWNVLHLPAYVLAGIGMHGDLAVWNLSVAAIGEEYGFPVLLVLLIRLAVLAGLVAVVVAFRPGDPGHALVAGTALLLGGFLAGSVSELSYTLLLAPGLIVAVTRARGAALVLLVAAVALLVLPHAAMGGVTSTLHAGLFAVVVAELLAFAGCVAVARRPALLRA